MRSVYTDGMETLFEREAYTYELPRELIAQHPCEQRDRCRLMIVERASGRISEMPFYELADFLKSGDCVVLNNTKVIPARLIGRRCTGGKAEIFLLHQDGEDRWEVLAKPARRLEAGSTIVFSNGVSCEVVDDRGEGRKVVVFSYDKARYTFSQVLSLIGRMPLPPYIERKKSDPRDIEEYQTVFARHAGAVAAPTAGLHFTAQMLDLLSSRGVESVELTLHVGLGTFRPVVVDDIRDHHMHSERFVVSEDAAASLNSIPAGNRSVCVGTTCCRVLESVADDNGVIIPSRGDTDIFIYPGYEFSYVSTLLTNFHLPGSTLLMMISAFMGYDLMMEAYRKAVEQKFRFYSYGDAMLIT